LDFVELQFVEKRLIPPINVQRSAIMTNERQNLPKNAAKVEFIAHTETIRSMLSEGYNLRNIHNKLRELHNLSMSYFALCDWYRRTLKEEKSKEQAKPTITPKTPSMSTPTSVVQKKLTRPEDIDRDTLF
jgi:hypothetical protein